MRCSRFQSVALTLLLGLAGVRPAVATWPHDASNGNVPLCTATSDQIAPISISDGAGGAIVVWQDLRSGSYDIYAQRISAAGDPLWAADGVLLCTAASHQFLPSVASDGAGGAFIAWHDFRTGALDIHAQRVSAAGVPQWTTNGVALCTAPGDQYFTTIAADGTGGAIVAWQDQRGADFNIYAQSITGAGATRWAANGVALCSASSDQTVPTMIPDAEGGAIVAWQDARSGTSTDIFAQRVSAVGISQWTANGVEITAAVHNQTLPRIASDGAGGGIVTWQDLRSGTHTDVYAQRVLSVGTISWAANGVPMCTAANNQLGPTIATDGAGGAIVTWRDQRGGATHDIYAQRVTSSGSGAWMSNGVALCVAANEQIAPAIESDGEGGAIVAWQDLRSGTTHDIRAQRVNGSGAPLWLPDGVAVCTAPSGQGSPAITSDGAGGAIISWTDGRAGTNADIYAQRIERFGHLGDPASVITSVSDAPTDQGSRVHVAWSSSYLDAGPDYAIHDYVLWRSVPPSAVKSSALLARGTTRDAAEAAATGALLIREFAGTEYVWESVSIHPAAGTLGFTANVPTVSDSVAGSNPLTAFMVEARSSAAPSAPSWFSAPDSGYSVDNLAPASPAMFTGYYTAGTTHLSWSPNTEADLAGYRLYRGSDATFVPGPGDLVATLADTGYTDAAIAPHIYKLTALDAHGNESPVATVIPDGILGAGLTAPIALGLAAPSPNPSSGAVTLEYSLSRAGHVRLSMFDALGRRLRVVCDEARPAGVHRAHLSLRDDRGRPLGSGVYLVRLEAEHRVLTRRLAAIH